MGQVERLCLWGKKLPFHFCFLAGGHHKVVDIWLVSPPINSDQRRCESIIRATKCCISTFLPLILHTNSFSMSNPWVIRTKLGSLWTTIQIRSLELANPWQSLHHNNTAMPWHTHSMQKEWYTSYTVNWPEVTWNFCPCPLINLIICPSPNRQSWHGRHWVRPIDTDRGNQNPFHTTLAILCMCEAGHKVVKKGTLGALCIETRVQTWLMRCATNIILHLSLKPCQ